MAPGVTFWDAGEFIAAAHTLGIAHPPGTPLFVALGHVWMLIAGGIVGHARAMNFVSAASTALGGGLAAWLLVRDSQQRVAISAVLGDARAGDTTADVARTDIVPTSTIAWGALTGALCAGLTTSVWANATETEVYAVSLVHVMAMLACAWRAGDALRVREGESARWTLCLAYLIALAPAMHLSALVGVPTAILLASRDRGLRWDYLRAALLTGVLIASAGVGRVSPVLTASGLLVIVAAGLVRRARESRSTAPRGIGAGATVGVVVLATSALLVMLVRAQHDPAINQGNPSNFARLAEVIGRQQYDVAGLWPRRAPVWIQLANLFEYADWQFGMGLGRGVFTTLPRILVTAAFAVLGVLGYNAMRRDARRAADAFTLLFVCGTLGVAAYLNLRAGSSIGYGFVPRDAHEARERDYFFVLGFWAWGMFAGYGAFSLAQRWRVPAWTSLVVALVPLCANWSVTDRAHGPGATAARDFAVGLLSGAPRNAVLFVGGDNDSYPLWYVQQVEGIRRDVTPVTLPLLPADWYVAEVARRTGMRWSTSEPVPAARWQHEQTAARIANAARRAGRPVTVSPGVTSFERNLLGAGWVLEGHVYRSTLAPDGSQSPPVFPVATASTSLQGGKPDRRSLPDDVSGMMLQLLDCPQLAHAEALPRARRDSLEVSCNLR